MQNEEEEKLEYLRRIQENRVVLNVGGLRFETSRLTLSKDPNSLLAKLFTKGSTIVPHGNSVFLEGMPLTSGSSLIIFGMTVR